MIKKKSISMETMTSTLQLIKISKLISFRYPEDCITNLIVFMLSKWGFKILIVLVFVSEEDIDLIQQTILEI